MAAAARPFLVNNNAGAGVMINAQLERRLHFHAAMYTLLGACFLLRAAVPRWLTDSDGAAGILLLTAAVALALLSFHHRRFPVAAMAAARLAQVALRAFF